MERLHGHNNLLPGLVDLIMYNRKKVWSWAFYDWANSAFSTTVMAGFFPIFFEKYWSNPNDVIQSTYHLGWANSIASIFIAAISPFLGAVADRGSAKKKFLFFFAFLGILMTGGLWMVGQGQWQMAVLFYVVASVGFMGGNIFYDSLLPSVASNDDVDYVSSLGFAVGYIGGGLLFLGELIRIYAVSYAGGITRTTKVGAPSLCTSGPYALTRNPLYFGNMIIFSGVTIITGGIYVWEMFLFVFIFFTFQYGMIISLEEETLVNLFGEDYYNYKNN